MKRSGSALLATLALGVGFMMVSLGGQQPQAGAVYTAAQAQAGQAAYTQQCAGCHLADFRGSGDAPAVRGPTSAANGAQRR